MSTTKDNVINVSFSPNCCAITVTPRYQWDKGVVLCIKNIQPKESVFLHCSFEGQRTPAYVMTTELKDGNLYGVIPDEMFQQEKQIRCYLYMDNGESGTTIFKVAIPVIPRAKPSDYIYDPMEVIPDVGELLSAWNTVRDVSEKASQVANMTVEAGTLPAGSAATASYQEGKLTLGIPRGMDSETALPTGYKPFDMLVVGPDGKPHWEERTHYDYSGTVLPLTDLKVLGGHHTFDAPLDAMPVVGVPYRVTYQGTEYTVTAKSYVDEGKDCVTLGNQWDLGVSGENTKEPFVILLYPPETVTNNYYGFLSCDATSASTVSLGIEGEGELKKIDPKFLPDGYGGGGSAAKCVMYAGLEQSQEFPVYKDPEMTEPMDFATAYAMLQSGTVSLRMFMERNDEQLECYFTPLNYVVVPDANVLQATFYMMGAYVDAYLLFSDTVYE